MHHWLHTKSTHLTPWLSNIQKYPDFPSLKLKKNGKIPYQLRFNIQTKKHPYWICHSWRSFKNQGRIRRRPRHRNRWSIHLLHFLDWPGIHHYARYVNGFWQQLVYVPGSHRNRIQQKSWQRPIHSTCWYNIWTSRMVKNRRLNKEHTKQHR